MSNIGHLIVVEGGEGVGKTVLCQRLSEFLKSKQQDIWLTKEPGGTALAEKIRGVFLHPPADEALLPISELLLISAARAQHVAEIKQKLAAGSWVVCDRFIDSTRVYQGIIGGLDKAVIEQAIEWSTAGLAADVTFFLDCPVEIALSRMAKRNKEDQPETRYDRSALEVHRKMRSGFQQLAGSNSDLYAIDASQSMESVFEQVLSTLRQRKLVADER